MTGHTPSRRRQVLRAASVGVLAAGIVVTSAGALGATSGGCGEYSYGFTGTRMINDGISDHAGPFSISLPAGTYDITMMSDDNHPSADYQVEQTQEQWYFTLDNGYTSPPTNDVPADQTHVTTPIGNVELTAATAISVHHLGEGGVNSVNVECIGFTPSAIEVAGPATTSTTIQVAVPPSVAPSVSPPTTAKAAVVTTTTAEAAAVTTTIATQVQGVVETPPIAQLAVTGQRSRAMIAFGLTLLGFGLAFVIAEQRVTRATSRT